MPTLPAVPKVVRVDYHFSQGNSGNIQFRNFYEYTGTLSLTDAATWLAAIQASLVAHVLPAMVTSISNTLVRLTDLSSTSSPQVDNTTGGAGTDGNQQAAAGTAFVIKEHIVRRYRGGHPRVYLPGMTAADLLTPTQWTSSRISTVLAAYVAFINANLAAVPVAAGVATPVNVSYFQGFTVESRPPYRPIIIPTPRVTPLIDVIQSFGANPRPASQRRRNAQSA